MKRTLRALAATFLFLAVSQARADYIVVIANLSATSGSSGTGGMIGGPMGPGGMVGGPRPGGMVGVPPGGMVGVPGGMIGGPRPGGMVGGPVPGGMVGIPGGMVGGPGPGGMVGGIGGMTGGTPSAPAEQDDDEFATLVITVLEVSSNMPGYRSQFETGGAVRFDNRWGKAVLQKKMGIYESHLVMVGGKALPTVAERFRREHARVFADKDTITAEALLRLARMALDYGLLPKFTETMDKLAEVNKDLPQVKNYLKVKEELAKKAPVSDGATTWKGRLLTDYRVAQKDDNHFALIHNHATDEAPEVTAHLARLERTFRGFYYWWALHKDTPTVLPMPKERLVAVLAENDTDFNRLKKFLSPGPLISDSFHARREGLSVFARRRGDEMYSRFKANSDRYWAEEGFQPDKLLTGKPGAGYPRTKKPNDVHYARTAALVLKALEHEWEINAASHEVGRQLLFATGLVAPKVHAPEWVQFGVGSMFESPLQSLIHGIGSPNSYYLPRFKEYDRIGKYGPTKDEPARLETLLGVITDDLFHQKPKKGADGKDAESPDAVQRRARAAAWSLMYFLAQQNDLKKLKQYFRELSKLPRDVDLDRAVLEATFAKAYGCVDSAGKPNRALLQVLANRWFATARGTALEGKEIHDQIRKAYATVRRVPSGGGTTGPTGPMGPGGRP